MKKRFTLYFGLIVPILLAALHAQEAAWANNGGTKSVQPVPYETIRYDPASPETMQWWEDAKFGLFVHWGVYAVAGGLWSKDHTFKTWLEGNPANLYSPHNYAEQIIKWGEMTFPEYEGFLPYFDWSKFNAQDFINLCFASGQHYIVITSKHCDGFAMWRSKASEWNIGDATPYGRQSGRDPLKELADACHATKTNGSPWEIKLCLYHSHTVDWHEEAAAQLDYLHRIDPTPEVFQHYLDRKVKPQLTELLTQYGEIGMIWFDVPRVLSVAQAQQVKDLVHKLSPNTIIDGRLGHDMGNYSNTGDNGTVGVPVAAPWETGSSINESYGYKSNAQHYKTPEEIIAKLIEVVAHGGNYLLNVGPKGDGTIPEKDKEILGEVGKWTKVNGEAVFGTRMTPFIGDHAFQPAWGECTQKGGNLYLLVTRWPKDGRVAVPLLQNQIKRISLLGDPGRKPLPHQRTKDANGNDLVVITVPADAPRAIASAIAVECEGDVLQLAAFKHAYDPAKKQIYLDSANFQAYASNVKALNLYYDGAQQAIVNWRQDKGGSSPTVAWTFAAREGGEYEVEIDCAVNQRSAGLPVAVLIDHQKQLSFTTPATGGDNVCKKVLVGTVRLEQGKRDLALELEKSDGNRPAVMQRLRGVYLTKK